MDATINISIGTKDYEFYNVPEKVGKAIITHLYECENDDGKVLSRYLRDYFISPVKPQEPKCKECRWWKDSDGKYRRGIEAESKCPINTHTVYCGEGYCYMFSPKAGMASYAYRVTVGD